MRDRSTDQKGVTPIPFPGCFLGDPRGEREDEKKTDSLNCIPSANIKAYFAIYDFINNIDLKVLPTTIPLDDFNVICHTAAKLTRAGWITKQQLAYINKIMRECLEGPKPVLHGKIFVSLAIAPKKRRPKNYALDFLVHALAYDAKLFSPTKMPNYSAIADFLQKNISKSFSDDEIRERFHSVKNDEIIDKTANFGRLNRAMFDNILNLVQRKKGFISALKKRYCLLSKPPRKFPDIIM